MPGYRRASSVPQQPAWAIEKRRNPFDSIRADAPGGEFKRKGNSVESAADFANDRRVGIMQLETTAVRSSALNKHVHGRKGERAGSRQWSIIRGKGQRMQSMDLLAFDLQRFPAGRQDMDLWSLPEDALRKRSNRLDQMLTTIEHQQDSPVAQESGERSNRIIEISGQAHGRRDHVGDKRRSAQRAKVDVMDCAVEGGQHGVADRGGNGGFGDPAPSDDGEEPPRGQLFRDKLDCFLASHHFGRTWREPDG